MNHNPFKLQFVVKEEVFAIEISWDSICVLAKKSVVIVLNNLCVVENIGDTTLDTFCIRLINISHLPSEVQYHLEVKDDNTSVVIPPKNGY